MINLDDVQDGIKELERAARLGLSGAMIPEYPLEQRRSDQSEYEPFWAAAAALDLPLSLHTASATARRFTRSRACPREGGGRHAPERLLPPQRRAELPAGRHRHSPARRHRCRQHDVGLELSAQRIDISPIAQ